MKLFDFIKIFFGENKEYYKLKKYDKSKNRFMISRFMSIQYPIEAQALNLNGTNPSHVVEAWHLVARKFNRTPKWMYTKVRKSENKIEDEFKPMDETIKFYINRFKLSYKDYETCVKFNKNELYKELENLEKEMQANKNL